MIFKKCIKPLTYFFVLFPCSQALLCFKRDSPPDLHDEGGLCWCLHGHNTVGGSTAEFGVSDNPGLNWDHCLEFIQSTEIF